MRVAFLILIHLIVAIAKLLGPDWTGGLLAETMAVKHQLLIASRSRKRAPYLTPTDRALLGFWPLVIRPHRLPKVALVVNLATSFKFHDALKKRRQRRLFSAHSRGKPGPKGQSQELIHAIVEMKPRNED